jgi:hypothetical protein
MSNETMPRRSEKDERTIQVTEMKFLRLVKAITPTDRISY